MLQEGPPHIDPSGAGFLGDLEYGGVVTLLPPVDLRHAAKPLEDVLPGLSVSMTDPVQVLLRVQRGQGEENRDNPLGVQVSDGLGQEFLEEGVIGLGRVVEPGVLRHLRPVEVAVVPAELDHHDVGVPALNLPGKSSQTLDDGISKLGGIVDDPLECPLKKRHVVVLGDRVPLPGLVVNDPLGDGVP